MASETDNSKRLSIFAVAEQLHRRPSYVLKLIEAGELPATDERPPGADKPQYRIDPNDIVLWRESRLVCPTRPEGPTKTVAMVVTGVVRKTLARKQIRPRVGRGRD